jgi:hypothetical protein
VSLIVFSYFSTEHTHNKRRTITKICFQIQTSSPPLDAIGPRKTPHQAERTQNNIEHPNPMQAPDFGTLLSAQTIDVRNFNLA